MVRQHGLRQADEGIAVDARLVPERIVEANVHLCRQLVAARADGVQTPVVNRESAARSTADLLKHGLRMGLAQG
jgi:hypothetical protein